MKIGSKFNIHLSYSDVHLHLISKFLFFSHTATMAGHHSNWSSAPEDLSHTELRSTVTDTTAITKAVMGHEDSVKDNSKKTLQTYRSNNLQRTQFFISCFH